MPPSTPVSIAPAGRGEGPFLRRELSFASLPPLSKPGLGHYDITSTPTKLGGDIAGVSIAQVATGGDFCLAVSADGDLFGWGNSEYLQLASVTESAQVRNIWWHLPFCEVQSTWRPPTRDLQFNILRVSSPTEGQAELQ